MDCCPISDSRFDHQFDARHAAGKLRAYRRDGPVALTRLLIDALAAGGIDGYTVLDIGGGVGAVHHELLRAGAAGAVDVDASRAYIGAAHEEAERQGHADRVQYINGDFVALVDKVEPADLVALDRVVCCYEDMASLVGRSAELARRRYGLVYPRDSLLGRFGTAFMNARFRLMRSPFRTYIHRTTDVEAILTGHGLVKKMHRTTLVWQLEIYERPVA